MHKRKIIKPKRTYRMTSFMHWSWGEHFGNVNSISISFELSFKSTYTECTREYFKAVSEVEEGGGGGLRQAFPPPPPPTLLKGGNFLRSPFSMASSSCVRTTPKFFVNPPPPSSSA